ncbi:MAG: hypothetical protein Q8Q23_00115 [bacterium]|nr:hypothetical protein [bacterium]
MRTRLLENEDLRAVINLLKEESDFFKTVCGEDELTQILINRDVYCVVAIDSSNLIAGIVFIQPGFFSNLSYLVVRQMYRNILANRGVTIGELLICKACEWLRNRGYKKVYITIEDSDLRFETLRDYFCCFDFKSDKKLLSMSRSLS